MEAFLLRILQERAGADQPARKRAGQEPSWSRVLRRSHRGILIIDLFVPGGEKSSRGQMEGWITLTIFWISRQTAR
jgi:hypothetical protein